MKNALTPHAKSISMLLRLKVAPTATYPAIPLNTGMRC